MGHRVFDNVPVNNGLLISLCEEDWARLEPDLHKVELELNQAVQVVGAQLEEVFFVEKGIISLIVTLLDGEQVEAGVAGSEGLVGIPLVLRDDRGLHDTRVQMAGTALRLKAAPLHDAMERSPRLRRLLLRYSLAFHAQVMVTAACNARHIVENRFARWLLLVHDRAGSDTFPMTHEFASMMLGVRRPSVSIAAAMLQKAGLIYYTRGQLTVLDRRGLQVAACECYETVRQEHIRLLGRKGAEPTRPIQRRFV